MIAAMGIEADIALSRRVLVAALLAMAALAAVAGVTAACGA